MKTVQHFTARWIGVVSPLAALLLVVEGVPAQAPSFDCAKTDSSVEELICKDEKLAALDRKMAEVYAAAQKKAVNERPASLEADQRGWIKGRNDCWKSEDKHACIESEYVSRIAGLQASYRLVDSRGPLTYFCENNPANEFVVTFFQTNPASAVVERGDQSSFMLLSPVASGSKYVGRNESFWEKGDEALIAWGHGAKEQRCQTKK